MPTYERVELGESSRSSESSRSQGGLGFFVFSTLALSMGLCLAAWKQLHDRVGVSRLVWLIVIECGRSAQTIVAVWWWTRGRFVHLSPSLAQILVSVVTWFTLAVDAWLAFLGDDD